MTKSRRIFGAIAEDSEDEAQEEGYDIHDRLSEMNLEGKNSYARRVMIKTCPSMNVHFKAGGTSITLDSGAETDLIRYDVAVSLGLQIEKSVHSCTLADKKTPLDVVGEVHTSFSRDGKNLEFNGLVVKELDVEVLGGIPFMTRNDIYPRPAKNLILFGDGSSFAYATNMKCSDSTSSTVRKATLLRATETTTVWPGEFLEMEVPPELDLEDSLLAVEPRSAPDTLNWIPASIRRSVGKSIRIENISPEPKIVKKHDHVCQVTPIFNPTSIPSENENSINIRPGGFNPTVSHSTVTTTVNSNLMRTPSSSSTITPHSSAISLDPNCLLSPEIRARFEELHNKYDTVFDPKISTYNHAFGKFEAVVNMGPVQPPQRKGRLPQYNRDKLCLLQDEFDRLEQLGVMAKPEDVGIAVEYLNPSFLVTKQGKTRLVTAFAEVGKYCKPQPSLLPTVDSTLRTLANWKFIVSTDLKSAYYQVPLNINSMKYCGTATPFKGTRVYTRAAMGLPGAESTLEELLCSGCCGKARR